MVELGGKLGSGVAALLFRFDGYFWRKFQQQGEMLPELLPIKVLRWINSAGQNALQRQNRGVRAAPHPKQSAEKIQRKIKHQSDKHKSKDTARMGGSQKQGFRYARGHAMRASTAGSRDFLAHSEYQKPKF